MPSSLCRICHCSLKSGCSAGIPQFKLLNEPAGQLCPQRQVAQSSQHWSEIAQMVTTCGAGGRELWLYHLKMATFPCHLKKWLFFFLFHYNLSFLLHMPIQDPTPSPSPITSKSLAAHPIHSSQRISHFGDSTRPSLHLDWARYPLKENCFPKIQYTQ